MGDENAVLAFNPDGKTLFKHEIALRDGGYAVISVSSAIQARYEIEMGRCGIFLLSYIVPPIVCVDLVGLFRRYCHSGIVIFLAKDPEASLPDAEIFISEEDDPQTMVSRIATLRAKAS
jgi:hypothetical protein